MADEEQTESTVRDEAESAAQAAAWRLLDELPGGLVCVVVAVDPDAEPTEGHVDIMIGTAAHDQHTADAGLTSVELAQLLLTNATRFAINADRVRRLNEMRN